MREPVQILDKDTASRTIEPIMHLIFQQLADDLGSDTVKALLPIDVRVDFTLLSGERVITTATMGSRCEKLEPVS